MIRITLIALTASFALSPALAFQGFEAGDGGLQSPPFTIVQETEEREPGPADLEEAIEIAEKRYGGRATRSETVEREGQTVHEIRVLGDDGIVRTVRIDPETGAIIPPPRR
jgi:uncharacterized iron-regulated membrane protein